MSRTALARVLPNTEPKRTRKPRARELVRVAVINPVSLGRLSAAQQLGAPLRCRLAGATLVVEVDRES